MKNKMQEIIMEKYIEEGKKIILPEKINNWINYIKSTDGKMESLHNIAFAIEIIQMLDYGANMETVIDIFNNIQCPVSLIAIRSLVANYSLRGPEFFEKTASGPLPQGNLEYLEELKRENARLLFIHSMRDSGYTVEEIPNGPIMVNAEDYIRKLIKGE